MVIDTSAIVAIALDEPEAPEFERRIAGDPVRLISAATVLEAAMVLETRLGEAGGSELVAARAGGDQFADDLRALRRQSSAQARRGRDADARDDASAVEGDRDGAGEVLLPGLREISQAPAPFHVIPRGWAGPSLLAMIVFEKFGQHQPLNRQAERSMRSKARRSRSPPWPTRWARSRRRSTPSGASSRPMSWRPSACTATTVCCGSTQKG